MATKDFLDVEDLEVGFRKNNEIAIKSAYGCSDLGFLLPDTRTLISGLAHIWVKK